MKKTLLLPLFLAFCSQAFAAEPAFTLKDNDTWVMAGDSITAQRLHSNFVEAFYRTRYPQLHLHFRNSGISGNRTNDILARFDYDVAAWKPTIVSIELGMNDVGVPNPESKDAPVAYVAGMKKLADNVRALKAQPLFISSSPVNDGSLMDAWTSTRCRTIHPFTEALKELGLKENVPVIDQYHPLISLWGPNKTIEDAGTLAIHIRQLKPDCNIPDLATLQEFAKSWEGKPEGIPLGGDPVHPGPVGQYTMAATILIGLNADREVSSATIKADGIVVATKGCTITDIVSKDGKLSFARLDERSPWPILSEGAPSLKFMPEIADLSHYILTIPGLAAGQYRVAMNDKLVATLSNEELAKGWNMSTVVAGPLGERGTRILGLISNLQNPLNNAWREASKAKDTVKLAVAQKAIDECEAQLQTACQPTPIRFAIEPATASVSSNVKLPGNAGPNLALHKTVITSTPNQSGWDGLVDGSWAPDAPNTFATDESPQFPKIVTIDLEKSADISMVLMGVPDYGSTKTIEVSVSLDGTKFTDVASYVFSQNKEEKHLYSFPATPARYVRLTYPDNYENTVRFGANYMFTSEVEVYAPPK